MAVVANMMFLMISECMAGDIKRGTLSLGAASNGGFRLIDRSIEDGNYKATFLSFELGYFIFNNIEIGSSVCLRYDSNDDFDARSYSLIPFLTYHLPLNEKSNIFMGIGAGYGLVDIDSDNIDEESTQTLFYGEGGYEYFLNRNVALEFGVKAEQVNFDCDETEETINVLTTQFKFKLFF